MLSVMTLALALALAAACKSGPSSSSGPSNSSGPSSSSGPSNEAGRAPVDEDRRLVAEAMVKMESLKNDMCRCQAGDKACAEAVEKDMKAYADSMKGKDPDPKSITEADKQKMIEMMTEMAKCQQAAYQP